MNFSWLTDPFYQQYLWTGFVNTLWLVTVSGTLGLALAIALALAQIRGPRPLAMAVRGFTTVIRGTPLLVQLFFFYDGVGRLLPEIPGVRDSLIWPLLRDPFFYGALTFTISVGAYTGEVLRGALLSVPDGELAAGRAFGLSRWQVLHRLWLPRAIQLCLPTLTGEAILLLKSVPLVSTIAMMDLLKAANLVRDETFLVYEPLLLIAGIYIALTLILTGVMRVVEHRFPGARPAAPRRRRLLPG
ncbi:MULTISPECIES: ABC transporter permease subunit [unclassified Modicisalibacter]|uniref:ABC transporter permease n=1 Tax=unclassified Modicisalibacter TaxID=2679913 RepID=UPI001CCC6418|nr:MULTISPECIES: ABC transporter permease subunit [unclassified Modicisalibacter]MBZ9557287.1 ABC transporter permease subunit [Modicisalibacter sp. R2A 31.J]MBZ9573999.1 ABC transporter permease subunit [Modicisalibacter sp. MOD 31.J]